MAPVCVRWFDADGQQIALMFCPGLHSAEARLDRRAPAGAVAVRVESANGSATYAVGPDGMVLTAADEVAAE